MACGIPMYRSDVICGSDAADKLATMNFGCLVQMRATDGIDGILTEQIKVVVRLAEFVGADETKFPVMESTPSRAQFICWLNRSGARTPICRLRMYAELAGGIVSRTLE